MVESKSAVVNKKITLIITATSVFISPFMISAVNIAMPTIGKEFSMSAVLLGWVATCFLLSSAALLIPFGRLADIYGRKKIFICGMALFTVSSFLGGIANSAILLIVYRVIQGISGAMTMGTAVAILTSVFPYEERGRAIGINMAAIYLGLSLGPFLGGILTQQLGWRSIFFVSAFLDMMVVILVLWRLRGEWAEAEGEKFDVIGSVVIGLSIIVGMYGFTVLPTVLGIILVLVGLLGMLVFGWWELRVESPVFNIGLFRRNAAFIFSNIATLINYSSAFAMAFLLSLYLQYNKGFSPQTAGLISVVSPVFMTVFAPMAGRLSDKIEPRLVASAGMAVTSVALLLFIFLNDKTALAFIIAGMAIYGIGTGLFSSPNTNAVMSSVDDRSLGVASGTVAMMRSIGMMLSMGLVMILFSIYIGHAEITPEYYPAFRTSMHVGFIIFTALCFGGIFAQLAGKKTGRA
jgi:EmrB/QacA subfamily drug resistance transporter